MNATKRKFNALLQGIGSRPASVSSQDKTADVEPPTSRPATIISSADSEMLFAPAPLSTSGLDILNKRRRIGLGGSPQGLKDASANGATNISNVVLRKFSGNGGEAKSTTTRYCPGDRDQLLKRLATFQELTDWTPKPDRVNEIEWAKRGWLCQGKERLRCLLCNKELVVKLNKKEEDGKEVPVMVPSEVEDALVDKYVELIVSAHRDDCLWRKKGCDDSLLRLPLADSNAALKDLRQRYDDLCARKDFLPYEFNLRLPTGLDVDAVLKNLPPTFFTEPAPAVLTSTSSPNRAALALALLGWQGLTNARIGPVPNSASCHACLRRLGLWMFKSKEVDPATNTILVPAPMDHLDPVREHRFFCPWKNGAVQRNPGRRRGADDEPAAAGWELLVLVIKNDAYLRGRARPNRDTAPLSAPPGLTETPGRPATSGTVGSEYYGEDGEEDDAARAAKDKERWARLRKVKSLFDTKGGKKLKRPLSRPGTGQSTFRPDTAGSTPKE
jgi:hypothetical protein